ncbi:hypothetical protein [Roseibacillus persicicus]|uniref:Uncharacterized protein n=1 Tax=Roseibacillus persicicus TaxID=454148 RepID=A0A918THX9_9BACT|nr:hypothetical protein [Roseibacillus persicicus]GHC46972.1 hypothetical protein GCM10007100_10850 [Roseibacillus persicicus]
MNTQETKYQQNGSQNSKVELGTPLPHDTSDFTPHYIPQDESQVEEAGNKGTAVVDKVKDTVKERGQELMEKTGTRVKDEADRGLHAASSQVRNLQRAVDSAGNRLNEQQPESLKTGTSTLSDGLEKVASYLESKDSEELLEDVRGVVRDHPAMVAGGLVLTGFLMGRILRVGESSRTAA